MKKIDQYYMLFSIPLSSSPNIIFKIEVLESYSASYMIFSFVIWRIIVLKTDIIIQYSSFICISFVIWQIIVVKTDIIFYSGYLMPILKYLRSLRYLLKGICYYPFGPTCLVAANGIVHFPLVCLLYFSWFLLAYVVV